MLQLSNPYLLTGAQSNYKKQLQDLIIPLVQATMGDMKEVISLSSPCSERGKYIAEM